jgi:hypothetical protein
MSRSNLAPLAVADLLDGREVNGPDIEATVEGVVWPNQHGDAIRDEANPQKLVLMPWARGSEITDDWRRYFDVRMSTMAAGGSRQIRIVVKGTLTRSDETLIFRVSEFLEISEEPRVVARSD